MNCLIAAGNTMTLIDKVRCITNVFSGRTGTTTSRLPWARLVDPVSTRTASTSKTRTAPKLTSTGSENPSLTDVGVRRPHNQDSHAVSLARDEKQWRHRGHVFLVADGMGAHAVGELASELAVSIIPHAFGKHVQNGAASALRKAFVEANASR